MLQYQVISLAIVVILSLLLMLFMSIIKLLSCCDKTDTESPNPERQQLLKPSPSQESTKSGIEQSQSSKSDVRGINFDSADQASPSLDKVSDIGGEGASNTIPRSFSIQPFSSSQEISFEPQVSGYHVTEQEEVEYQNVKQTQSNKSEMVRISLEGQASDTPDDSDMPSVTSEEGGSDPHPRPCQVQAISSSQEISFNEQQVCRDIVTNSSIPSTTSNQVARDKSVKANDSKEHFLKEGDLKEIMDKTWKAREKWFNIGIQLEMSVSDLKVISQNKSGQPDGCFVEMLVQWLRQGKATWEALINALKSEPVGYLQLANEITESTLLSPGPLARLHAVGSEDESTVNDSTSLATKSEEGGMAFRCKCQKVTSIKEFLDKKCSCTEKWFPYLDHSKLTPSEQHLLEDKLLKETRTIVIEFADLVESMKKSLKELDPKDIASYILSIAPSEPSTASILRTLDMKNITSICDIIIHLQRNSYISFFNYHIVQYLIKAYGTLEAQSKLDRYTSLFQKFCQRSVFEVPQHVYGQAPSGSELLAIKVVSTRQWSARSTDLSLEEARTVHLKVVEALGLKNCWNLPLLNAAKGCVVLTFALPQVYMELVKPLLENFSKIDLDGYSIHVLCAPPGKPYATKVTTDSISLAWKEPQYQGSYSIVHYCVCYHSATNPMEKTVEITTNNELTVEGLSHKSAASFVFKVKAYTNEIDDGTESEESDPIHLLNVCSSKIIILQLNFVVFL